MSTPQEKLERRFEAWWCARGFIGLIGYGGDHDTARDRIKYGWMADMKTKEQG